MLLNFNSIIAVIVMLFWMWSMTVGPFGHLWGFKTPKETSKPVKSKSEWKKGKKITEIEYRDVHSNTEKIETPEGTKYAEQTEDYIIRESDGKETPIKKKELEKMFDIEDEKA
jgi:cytoskeletal protein RodZ